MGCFFIGMNVITQNINLENSTLSLHIRREDMIHPLVSGNKYRKLKYNLEEAQKKGFKTLLTFGGAFSNHISAVAFAGQEKGYKTIGIVRGDELKNKYTSNPTLYFANKMGMQLDFVSRDVYKNKSSEDFIEQLKVKYGDFYLLPEGGTNVLAIKGCEEILTEDDKQYDYICCAIGTGGTIAGIINTSSSHQKVLGFPALKGDFLKSEIRNFATGDNWELITDYHFGGYGKTNDELIRFINLFYEKHKIPLDPIYTGKMMFGICNLAENGYFAKNSRILAIHTGGIQGIQGMNIKLSKQKRLKIEFDV